MTLSARQTYLRFIAALMLAALCFAATAQERETITGSPNQAATHDSIIVSIITCGPGRELYSRFGHTAIRVRNLTLNQDIVFNYGCFNYNEDNFIFKFLTGQTDYMLEAEHFQRFIKRYERMGNGVEDQMLNLTYTEKAKILSILSENLKPENQRYRYNWLYDNCTERARDVVEQAIEGKLYYRLDNIGDYTARELIEQNLEGSEWTLFGINMILGQEIDKILNYRLFMFIPKWYYLNLAFAVIADSNGEIRRMAAPPTILLHENLPEAEKTPWYLTPENIFLCLAIILGIIAFMEFVTGKHLWPIDITVHTVQGLVGILVSFLFFFSSHPGASTNWLVLIFNPLALFYAAWIYHCHRKKKKNKAAFFAVILTLASIITITFCPQKIDDAMSFVFIILTLRTSVQFNFALNGEYTTCLYRKLSACIKRRKVRHHS